MRLIRFGCLLSHGERAGKMADYDFSMPYPPTLNTMWAVFRGRKILSKKGRLYRDQAINHLREIGLYEEEIKSKLSVSMVINPPTLRKYDIDNFCKAPFDALSHAGFWLDDEQVYSLIIKKGEKTKGGNIQLKIDLID